MAAMSIVKINVLTVPEEQRETLEKRFASRAGTVENSDGFEWFELLRPVEGTDSYLVYTRWSSEEAYQSWQSSQDFDRAHDGGGDTLAPAAERSQNHLWSYDVIESAGPQGSKG